MMAASAVQGSWCRLQSGLTSLLGRTWDYCGAPCGFNGTRGSDSGLSPPPPQGSDGGIAFATNAACSSSQVR